MNLKLLFFFCYIIVYGVKDANDKLFDTIFEKTYTASQLKNTPWFHILGNHDYYGNVQGQIDYQSRSNRW